jgi:signal transduction histidine kinase
VIALAEDKTVTPTRVFGVVIATVPFVALAWRPRLAERLIVLAGICWLSAVLTDVSAPDDLVMCIGVYTVATQTRGRRLLESVLAAMAFAAIVPAVEGSQSDLLNALGSLAVWGVLLLVLIGMGTWVARRRQLIETLVGRTRDLERETEILTVERDEMARQAVADERARIARELHDVVAHHVSVMVIQAGAAQASLPPGPASVAANQSIEAIRETGREALAEMRRMLGLLRSEAAASGGGVAAAAGTAAAGAAAATGDRTPQPGLTDVAALCERMREAGVNVAVEVSGPARKLPAGIDLSIYRVVQEALTNTLRHGGPGSSARLRLLYEPASLTVEITDDGRGRPAVGSVERPRHGVGHGLLGMRERVLLFGGRLETGPLAGGGFRVLACFPLEPIAEESGVPMVSGMGTPVGAQSRPDAGEGANISSSSSSSSSSSGGVA